MIILATSTSSPPWDRAPSLRTSPPPTARLPASTVDLKTSRRFAEGSVIAKLAAAINHDGGISSSTACTTVKRLLADAQTDGDLDWRIAWDDAMPQGEGGYGLAPAVTAWLEERFSRYTAALIDYMRVVTRLPSRRPTT